MIETLYKRIDDHEVIKNDDYNLSLNGVVYKKIPDKHVFYNQKKLTPFYMWTTSGSIESSAIISNFDQLKYLVTSSVDFSKLERSNKNIKNQKIYFNSASFGYVLSDKSYKYDTTHKNILYYYGYANRFGYGTPFNTTSSNASANIPSESRQLSPSKIAYTSIKNIISDENFVKHNRIQIKDNFFTDEFVYVKIPRHHYHEELLKGSFEITLVTGSMRLDLADISQYNIDYNEDNIVYLVSASNQTTPHYVNGELDIYGILDRKNALAIIDVNRLNTFFGSNIFITSSFASQTRSANILIYKTESFGVVTAEDSDTINYSAAFYPNLETLSILLYSGSRQKNMKAIGLETEISDQYYIKINATEFNKSTNPTYLNNWKVKPNFITTPITYITTIGLYNDDGDCLAIAKLSKPLKKEYDVSHVIKIELKQ